MTVPAGLARQQYAGSGTTGPFAFNHKTYVASHLSVTRTIAGVDTALVLTTDYIVSLATDFTSATITLISALAVGQSLTVVLDPPIEQQIAYADNDPFPAATHERALDLAAMVSQALAEKISRSLLLREGSPITGLLLPDPVALAFLRWNAAANALESALFVAAGTIVIPGLSTDNALVRWNGTTGDAIQNSTAILSDVGGLSLATLAATGAITGASVAATGAVTGATVAATGAITGASVAATGAVSGATLAATGAITGASVATTGAASVGTNLDVVNGFIDIAEIAAPANPAANKLRIYAKDLNALSLPFWRDNGGTERAIGSGEVLLVENTFSGAAQVDIVLSGWTSEFRSFRIAMQTTPANDGVQLLLRTSTNGGSSYDAGASDYSWAHVSLEAVGGASTTPGSSADTSIRLASPIGNAANEGAHSIVELFDAANAARNGRIFNRTVIMDSTATSRSIAFTGHGVRTAAQDIDALRFLMSAGNMSGTYQLYGLN